MSSSRCLTNCLSPVISRYCNVRKCYLILLGIFIAGKSIAQFGGRNSYEFLNVPTNARLAGLGGVNVSLANRDINFFFSNPALVTDSLSGYASAGYTFYVADIGQASFAYTHRFDRIGTVSFGVQHMGYGEMQGYDETGAEIGSFKSGETALVISKSHTVSAFTLGVNLKGVFSSIAGFRSNLLLFDIGGTFVHPKKNLTVGLAIKNIGFVLSDYSGTSNSKIPFDVQAGVTFKPEHMPLRFSLTAYNLAHPGKAFNDPNDSEDDPGAMNKVMQHVNFGAEVLLHKNVNILLGYNVLKQKELKTDNQGGGITFGAALKIKSFDIVLSRSGYSVSNAAYSFTVAANLNNMIFKKRTL
jgi:hypothetical protein